MSPFPPPIPLIASLGVELRPLSKELLDQVRAWRNMDHVRFRFEHTALIGEEEHRAWYEGLDAHLNFYWTIWVGEEPIGVIHIKDISTDERQGEAGIFIGEKDWLGTAEPIKAVLAMMDWAFAEDRFQALTAKVQASAEATLRFNRKLGYQAEPGQEGGAFIQLNCQKEDYLRLRAGFRL